MLRLDPHLAVFRSAPDRIAIGAQQPVAELDADDPTLLGIAALTRGVVRRELEHLLGDEPAAVLLRAVGPALEPAPPTLGVRVRGRIPLADALHRAARLSGHPARDDGLVLPVAAWRLPDAELERLAASRLAHLPVVVGDVWVQVGPFVPAGAGCAHCARQDATRLDGDALLPGHLTPVPSPIAAAQTVVTVLGALRRAADEALPAGWGARIRQCDAAVSALRRSRARCPHRSRPGTAMAA
ncbi:hypothetical protein ABIB37_001925 [Agrococcus sp. UYP10]|uniref:hypothetical protein n=1 Tax=Agrococcus sp. UYP10 TaxID=1756355 RepID=UPI00339AA54E